MSSQARSFSPSNVFLLISQIMFQFFVLPKYENNMPEQKKKKKKKDIWHMSIV